VRVTGFSGLTVDQPSGDRWDLALELLASGESAVSLDGVILRRDAHGPRATGRIAIDIPASSEPRFLTPAVAKRDVSRALALIDAAREADPRFAELLTDHGVDRTYIDDYGNGSVALGDVNADGELVWHPEWAPGDAR